ncbi:MAG: hypothetical protein RIT04_326 [Candidatus Parcubacteria bacterium]|jgi:hypothetical protein
MFSQITHAVRKDAALCGFTSDPPDRWPEGHTSASIFACGVVNCPGCMKGMQRIWENTLRSIELAECGLPQPKPR